MNQTKGQEINAVTAMDAVAAVVGRYATNHEGLEVHGQWTVEHRGPTGDLISTDVFDNLVTTEGKNMLLDNQFSTNVTPNWFVGLISSVSYSTIVAADTAAQINGTNAWKEGGSSTNYPLVAARLVPSWSAAASGSKSFSSAVVFTVITTGGTVKGCILIGGTGAVSTIASTAGKLYSAGLFSGGDKVLGVGDTLSVSYTASA